MRLRVYVRDSLDVLRPTNVIGILWPSQEKSLAGQLACSCTKGLLDFRLSMGSFRTHIAKIAFILRPPGSKAVFVGIEGAVQRTRPLRPERGLERAEKRPACEAEIDV